MDRLQFVPLSRRQILGGAAASLVARGMGGARRSISAQELETLTIALAVSPIDLDPQSAFEERSALVVGAIYEPLIRYAGDRTDEFEGVLAESWSTNDDRSVWTFTLREGVRFQDGSPCDAAAVKESFNRLFTLGLGPATELARFLTSADQIETPDERTVVFTLDRPQPLFEQCVGSGYGAAICNAAVIRSTRRRRLGPCVGLIERGGRRHWSLPADDLRAGGPGHPGAQRRLLARLGSGAVRAVIVRVVPEGDTRRQLLENGDVDIVDTLTPRSSRSYARTRRCASTSTPPPGSGTSS